MANVGDIHTSFVTARLPMWAGIRQNVVGSDIEGHPVESQGLTVGSASAAVGRATTVSEQITQLAILIDALTAKVAALENQNA